MSQHMEALTKANEVRLTRALQRASLRGCRPDVLVRALVDPPDELASYRLCDLFAPRSVVEGGPVVQFGIGSLQRAIDSANAKNPIGRITSDHRLRDLTKSERRRLAAAVLMAAPKPWRTGE